MRVGVFHPGTQHSWQTALAFQEAGTLAWYATSVFYDPARWPYKLERFVPRKVSASLNREFRRRQNVFLSAANVRQFGFWEWSEIFLRRMKRPRLADYCNERGNRAFCAQAIRLIEREPVDVLWGFNTSSLEVFQWAKKRGIRCVLDQTIGHPATQNQVMLDEQQRHPEFFIDSYRPFDQTAIDRQNAEIAEADLVVVGSDYCAGTLVENGCPAEKILVVHYGYDESLFPVETPLGNGHGNRPAQFLFAGEVGPRKGIAYLLQAFANLPADKAELTLVGRMAIPPATFKKYAARVRHVPQVPRSEVVRFFAEADCFVFPSLFEGSAIVLYEACGAGLGIVQTARCGDGVRLGQNGHILDEITVPALIEVVEKVTEDADLRQRWQAASWAIRKERTWGDYRKTVANLGASLNGRS
ncbi:MAG TPA: glycosyltransferase family 4 protein [Verrucomicrobiae bacterium]|nr:glycosyltransferase family 4 protein [Verrucomicrobiae bacterium]